MIDLNPPHSFSYLISVSGYRGGQRGGSHGHARRREPGRHDQGRHLRQAVQALQEPHAAQGRAVKAHPVAFLFLIE